MTFNRNHSNAPKGAEYSLGGSDRIQFAPFSPILLSYGAHILLIICPGSEDGTLMSMIQS